MKINISHQTLNIIIYTTILKKNRLEFLVFNADKCYIYILNVIAT